MSKTFLFISAQYLPSSGGVERYTHNLARKLIADGHHVIVATSSLRDLPAHEISDEGIEIFRFASIPFMNGRLPLIRPGKVFSSLGRELWSRPIDFCVINTYFYPLSMYAATMIHRKKIPAVVLNHGSAWLMTGSRVLQLAGQLYEHIAVRICKHFCPRFFGVSQAAAEWMTTFSVQAEGIITNAIDPVSVENTLDTSANLREELQLPDSAKIIAFVGRMIPEKGVVPLIEAMRTIRKTHPDAALLMAGEGPLLEEYRDRVPEGVFLLGVQPYPRVLSLLKQADLFCLPSRSEGFACTVLEAAALLCPIVTTATGGSPQLLISEEYGILIGDMHPESISAACIRALSDPDWRKKAASLSRERLIDNFTWDAALLQLYRAFGL